LRWLIMTGEALKADLVERWWERHEGVKVMNAYGPTECSDDVAHYVVEGKGRGEEQGGAMTPIGNPVQNTRLYVLDRRMEAVPVGVAGELYVGGKGVGRGYWRDGVKTAEVFVPDPFSGRGGERLYRTGDMARWRGDGRLEFLGRMDDQVKVRGYRIELGEIEVVVGRHPGVEQCVVVVREEEGSGEKRLVGYVVEKEGAGLSVTQLRSYMQERLPRHMIPAVVVKLEQMPLTAHGKLDRKRLPEVKGEWEGADGKRRYVGPETEAEEKLCRIWGEVLRVERVGVEDNFFELGGDSILSIQIVARANREGLRITPRQMFEQQRVRGLARVAGRGGEVKAEQGRVKGEVVLTPIQRRFFEEEMEERHHFNQAVLLGSRKRLEGEWVKEVVGKLLEQHDGLRMRYRRGEEGEWRQENVGEEDVEGVYVEVDLSGVEERRRKEELERVAGEWQRSLNLERGPVVRVVLVEMGEEEGQRLLLVIHHLVVDGVSWRVLLEDLERGYGQRERGEEVELGRKSSSYQEWAKKLEEYAGREEVREEEEYWKGVVRREGLRRLPREEGGGGGEGRGEGRGRRKEEEENLVETVERVGVEMSEEETRVLLQEVPQVYRMQIQEVVLAAVGEALGEWGGEGSWLVDLEGHGREEVSEEMEVTRTVGWFTSIYPVRLEVGGGEGGGRGEGRGRIEAVLKRVKEQMRGIPKRGLGYGLLRYMSGAGGAGARLAEGGQAEVSFNYLGQVDQVVGEERLLQVKREEIGGERSGQMRRRYLVEISAVVEQGRLQVGWRYSGKVHERERMERVVEGFRRSLEEMIEHCRRAGEEGYRGYSPSDFGWVKLKEEEVEEVAKGGGEIEEIYPLTPVQEGMLFHTLYEPEGGMYVQQMSCVLEGELREKEMEEAWQEVVDRHESLRGRYEWEGLERGVQVVEKRVKVEMRVEDWRGGSEEEQEQWLEERMRKEEEEGFDVRRAPLMRWKLMRLGEKRQRMLWSHHHLVLDGWSLPVVLEEVFRGYRERCGGEGKDKDKECGNIGKSGNSGKSGKRGNGGGVGSLGEYVRWMRGQKL
jgi:non-ribosomal peptide synthase protein (TIGR01720 family)